MKRVLAFLTLLTITAMLFACGGGGGGGDSSTGDTTAPTVDAFTMQATSSTLAVGITACTASDATGVAGYLVTASSTAPSASDPGWTATAPTSFTFSAAGAQTAYAWAKDAAGNVSLSRSAAVTITVPGVAAAVSGVAINPQAATPTPLVGATVNAYVQPAGTAKTVGAPIVAFATTDANGNFTITGLVLGTNYYFEFVMSGYVVFTYYNIVPTSSVLLLETVRPIPVAWQTLTANVSGKVKNASTNVGLPSMTVKIRPGVNNHTGTITATTTTSSTGAYSFAALAAGVYTAEVTGNIGSTAVSATYFTVVSFPGNTAANTNQDLPVPLPLPPGQYRIVLNWGNNPSDLDSHLTGPIASSSSRFHTAYYADDYPSGSSTSDASGFRIAGANTQAFLDVDNTSHGFDNGPETTTIVVPRAGNYKFYVHHFSGSSTISASGAQVKVYKGSSLLATFNPPASSLGVEAVWSVFTMDVTASGETIAPVNTISMIESTTLPKAAGPSFDEYFLFSALPAK